MFGNMTIDIQWQNLPKKEFLRTHKTLDCCIMLYKTLRKNKILAKMLYVGYNLNCEATNIHNNISYIINNKTLKES